MKKVDPNLTKSEAFDPAAVEERLKKWLPELTPAQVKALVEFHADVLEQNKTLNLVGAQTLKNIESVHTADSVLAARIIAEALDPKEPIYIFGGSNGFPGLVFGLLWPTRSVICLERDRRRIEFCKGVAERMGLKNVTFESRGLDELPEGCVKYGVARNFAPFARALLITRKQFAKGGKFLHMKGDGWANELAQLPSQLFSHWKPSLLGSYRLPETTNNNFVVLMEKISD